MPDARIQLAVEIETEGAEQLTALRRQLDSLSESGRAAFAPLDASLSSLVSQLRQSRQLVGSLEPIVSGFFTRLLTNTRNFREAFRRLLLDLLQLFLRTVAQMLAAWISGLGSMRQIFHDILGRIFGGGGGGFNIGIGINLPGIGRTPPTFPGSFLPGFAGGGLVDQIKTIQSTNGQILALLHRGEAVLNPGAVRLLGPARILALNRAGGGSGVPDIRGGRPAFQGGGLVGGQAGMSGALTINVFVSGAGDPRAVANAVIREIRRRARDRGLPRPV